MTLLWSATARRLPLSPRDGPPPRRGRPLRAAARARGPARRPALLLVLRGCRAPWNLLLAAPLLIASANAAPRLHPLEWAAAALWAIALAGESLADRQLDAFRRDPANRGRTCRVGLWSWSRHPNYFFEWLVWVAYWLFACASPWGWTTLFCPALMLYFLFRVTGIPATEAQALRTRGDDYREYQRTTSAFVPLLPRR